MTNEWSPICYPIDTTITLGDAIKERIEADKKINEKEVVIPIDKQLRHSLPECGYKITGNDTLRVYPEILLVDAYKIYQRCNIDTKHFTYNIRFDCNKKTIWLENNLWDRNPLSLQKELENAIKKNKGNPLSLVSTLDQDDIEDCLNDQLEWTAWCDGWVYFPVMCDDHPTWIGSVPSSQCDYKSSIQCHS